MAHGKLFVFAIYICAILFSICVTVIVGSELIIQYEINATGSNSRSELADDFGLGLLLIFGLIPEIILGCLIGWFLGQCFNAEINKST